MLVAANVPDIRSLTVTGISDAASPPRMPAAQQGSDLGLFIARTIINTYGGRIWAENRIGDGAIFHFTLVRALELTA